MVDGESTATTPSGATTGTGEKAAFEAFIDLVIERLDRDPGDARLPLRRLRAGRHQTAHAAHPTREDEVDRLLRGGVLVDLYQVVRQGIRASVESYSIKRIETFYMSEREGPVTEAGFSVVEYETLAARRRPAAPADLADYNRDDCVSTRGCATGSRRGASEAELAASDVPLDRPPIGDGLPTEAQVAAPQATLARIDALTDGRPGDPAGARTEQAGRWLLAALLDWHRRDDEAGLVGLLPAEGARPSRSCRRARADRRPRVRRRVGAARSSRSSIAIVPAAGPQDRVAVTTGWQDADRALRQSIAVDDEHGDDRPARGRQTTRATRRAP